MLAETKLRDVDVWNLVAHFAEAILKSEKIDLELR